MTSAARRIAIWLFRRTLLALPEPFRHDVRGEMEETFELLLDAHTAREGVRGIIAVVVRSTIDVVRVGITERRSPTRHRGTPTKGQTRDEEGRMRKLVGGLWFDLRYAGRALARQPAVTAVARSPVSPSRSCNAVRARVRETSPIEPSRSTRRSRWRRQPRPKATIAAGTTHQSSARWKTSGVARRHRPGGTA